MFWFLHFFSSRPAAYNPFKVDVKSPIPKKPLQPKRIKRELSYPSQSEEVKKVEVKEEPLDDVMDDDTFEEDIGSENLPSKDIKKEGEFSRDCSSLMLILLLPIIYVQHI